MRSEEQADVPAAPVRSIGCTLSPQLVGGKMDISAMASVHDLVLLSDAGGLDADHGVVE